MTDVTVEQRPQYDDTKDGPLYSVPIKKPPPYPDVNKSSAAIACPQRQRDLTHVGAEYYAASPVEESYYYENDKQL